MTTAIMRGRTRTAVVVTVARTPRELRDAQRFRAEVYERAGWRVADEDGLDRDAYDPTGVTIVARAEEVEGPRIVGSVRVTRMVDDRFMLEHHGVRVPGWLPRPTTGEVTRWAVVPIRRSATSLWLALGAAVWMREQRFTHALCVLTPASLRALSRSSLRLMPLGPPRAVVAYGREETLHPVWIPVPDEVSALPSWVQMDVIS